MSCQQEEECHWSLVCDLKTIKASKTFLESCHKNKTSLRVRTLLFELITSLHRNNTTAVFIKYILLSDAKVEILYSERRNRRMGGQNSKLDHLQDSRDVMMKRDENRMIAKHGNSETLGYIPRRGSNKSGSVVMMTKESTSQKRRP